MSDGEMLFVIKLCASLSTVVWLITTIRVVLMKKKEIPAVIVSTCFSCVLCAMAYECSKMIM